MSARHPLDNPAYESLSGAHAHLAERRGAVLRYQPDVAPFLALPSESSPDDWDDVAALAGPDAVVPLAGLAGALPAGWQVELSMPGVQMTGADVAGVHDDEAVLLGPEDVPEMLDLVARTQPGPFLPRTIALGAYLGIRRGGALVAMAGERLRPRGWTEISAVCTDDAFRGQGLATRLVLAVAAGIRERGETPFLHARADNTTAIRLYETLGFRLRQTTTFLAVRVPTYLAG
ncbi:GNAT family N-acetyltransferase [Planotetraspora sp. A-T 1434]|uniref:GNAT family N-acetyltransferase n=1 Tax=Planotetraspora sp. A-T 1434 TaxID=2979219 RepID=UPI0021BE817B|nr:GNAT family N-acetyltransferase [Planotetraspora sp. A-T 1434]MCT9934439.1 GNAT family N-acetyltransferase [Planotetraspora sp. A-T 1434]